MEEKSQIEFSEFVKVGLLQEFPNFKDFIRYNEDILIIEIPSEKKFATFWITTQDNEITIGFDNKNGECSWHTHMSLYGAYEPTDELKTVINLIKGIFSGLEILVIDSNSVINLTRNPQNDIKDYGKNRTLEFRNWNEI